MHPVGKIPRWLVDKDPSWERAGNSESNVLEWVKKGSDLRAKCDSTDWYCDVIIADRRQSFDLSKLMPNPSSTNILEHSVSDLRKYLSSRYLNPGFHTNRSRLPKDTELW